MVIHHGFHMFDYQAFSNSGPQTVSLTVGNPARHVVASTFNDGTIATDFIHFNMPYAEGDAPGKSGWKADVSINPEDMERALNIAIPLMGKYGIDGRAVRADKLDSVSDPDLVAMAGKHFTFYENAAVTDEGVRSKASFIRFLTELELVFNKAGIRRWEPTPNAMNTLIYGQVAQGQGNDIYQSHKNGYVAFDRPVGTYSAIRSGDREDESHIHNLIFRYKNASTPYGSMYKQGNTDLNCAFDQFGLNYLGVPVRLEALAAILRLSSVLLSGSGADEAIARTAKDEALRVLNDIYGDKFDNAMIADMLPQWQMLTGLNREAQATVLGRL